MEDPVLGLRSPAKRCSSRVTLAVPLLELLLHACLENSVSVCLRFVGTYRASDAAWAALGDPSRRAIIECLAERPQSVRELADELPISRPAVSQHLKALKNAGLVADRAAGTRRIYQLNPTAVGALRDQLDAFWNRALTAYKEVAEQSRGEKQ